MEFLSLHEPLQHLAAALRAHGWRMATAESCTGGLIAAACTSLAGSSDWFECGFVTYSNEAKTALLGVPAAQHEAVLAAGAKAGVAVTHIGGIEAEPGLRVVDAAGRPVVTPWRSFDHFT